MFNKILIANRGEIACRIARTCKRLGIQTVAIFSDADQDSLHVKTCDEAYYVGTSSPSESYLQARKIIDVALSANVQAIHPGYGFLSENAVFASECERSGLVFIGPSAAAIRAMGSKSAAKALMQEAAVPLVPGYHGENQDPEFLKSQADLIKYPVLLKASAGGGGKGMRIVNDESSFLEALKSCQREAQNSFGDQQILLERYLERSRHIEVQIFADRHEHCVYLFDRDCSIQRRHQKVLEEAPAPFLDESIKREMGQAAVNAAKAVGYEGAGTVEFIAEVKSNGQVGDFYFMEMNTRLQVEHPVTEMITGQDLVEWQIRVAYGERLPLLQNQIVSNGHAFEVRIYAENPEYHFLPSTGKLIHMEMPTELVGSVRVDTGVQRGDRITPYYDPMIAKLIVWGRDRSEALEKMKLALNEVSIVGLSTNVAFLGRLLRCNTFAENTLETSLISKHEKELLQIDLQVGLKELAFLLAYQLQKEKCESLSCSLGVQTSPWQMQDAWRLNGSTTRKFDFLLNADSRLFTIHYHYQRKEVIFEGISHSFSYSCEGNDFKLNLDGGQSKARLMSESADSHVIHLFNHGRHQVWSYQDPLQKFIVEETSKPQLFAPMPGKVVSVHTKAGEYVKKGDVLMVIEAMKMEHSIVAPYDAQIAEVNFMQGEQVSEADEMIVFVSE